MIDKFLFLFFAVLMIGSAIMMVTRRNIVHSAVYLITTLLATAGIFLQLKAEFLFIVQIILYVGGIMVLFVFVIMLVNLDVAIRMVQFSRQGFLAGVLVLVLAVQIFLAFRIGRVGPPPNVVVPPLPAKNTEAVAEALFQHYMLPFEIASILLLVAMIGAVVMAKRRV